MKRFTSASFLLLIWKGIIISQQINNNSPERFIQSNKYFRVNYENDFFAASDLYYTQGFLIETAHPSFARSPLNHLLLRPAGFRNSYILAIEDNGYTPTNYKVEAILEGDRPYAGMIFIKSSVAATSMMKKRRLISSISIGLIGQGAGGKEIQTSIHEWTSNAIPLGWHNQVKNDLLLNYEVEINNEILNAGKYLNLSWSAMARVGTLSDKVNLGLHFITGKFANPFSTDTTRTGFNFHFYDRPEINVIGYDATMQGGIFNKSSPYILHADQITRIVARNSYGVVFNIGRLYLEYYQSMMTREFKTGRPHKNGGINIGYSW